MTKTQVIWIHIVYWLYVFIISEFVNKLAYQNKIFNPLENIGPLAISNYIIFCSLFYLNYFTVLPYFFRRKKYLLTLISWLLIVFAFIAIRYVVQEIWFLKYFGLCNYCLDNTGIYVVNNFFQGFSTIILAGTVIWFIVNWLKMEKQKRLLEQEKLEAERAFLQSQVNPHFLFNTLNNIYSMVYHASPHSLSAIQKLSDIMRYSLREKDRAGVSLTMELKYLNDFIELQAMRTKDPAIHYQESGNFENQTIMPMLLISFVENAFKHGVLNDPKNPLSIKVNSQKNILEFAVRNKINDVERDHSSGVGLQSVKKRLDLSYPGKYKLEIDKTADFYSSKLILQL